MSKRFKVWGHCDDCHFDGLIYFSMIDGEDYDDPDSLGVMLVQDCPSCEVSVNTFIPMDLYQEFLVGYEPVKGDEEST
ncbi:MAG: hypothetical protein OQK78_13070 [Gammaproteobacteria bacterium]|nr:hypothetical protein [Gammaproteobacteria bacterium]MCW8887706.1 hypothetical protein [Gammaproteobacteria bacterium]MCW8983403.1 hypothetical protein [Gammaproteobacteria bacterium]